MEPINLPINLPINMPINLPLNRRSFLLSALPIPLYAAGPLGVFTAAEVRIVEALCAQIIPADDAPGAKEAGVLYYIDRQLAGPLQRFQARYKTGLAEFRALPEMPFAAQTAALKGLKGEAASFFALVVDHAMQGFYGDPAHGGNRDEASWKMMGIADPMGEHKH
jgi:gluconate 2-dehydrogenase gamma chain